MKQLEESAKAEPWAALSLSQSEPASAELTYLLSSEPIAPVSSELAYPIQLIKKQTVLRFVLNLFMDYI